MSENISPVGYLDLEQISRNNFKLFSDYSEIENISNCQTESLKKWEKSRQQRYLWVCPRERFAPHPDHPPPYTINFYMTIFKNVQQN